MERPFFIHQALKSLVSIRTAGLRPVLDIYISN